MRSLFFTDLKTKFNIMTKQDIYEQVYEWVADPASFINYTEECKKKIYNMLDEYADAVKNNAVLPHVMPSFDSPKNWTEDYKHENGNYVCRCSKCKEYFYGHKRRPLCKKC